MADVAKIRPDRVTVDHDGQAFRHIVVNLMEPHTVDAVRESPAVWSAVQGVHHLRVKRGDRVSLVSADGLTIGDQFVVTRAEGGSVWLGKPLRLIQLEMTALYSDGTQEVVPVGTGYGVRNVRDGALGNQTFTSADAAKNEILRRQPTKVA